MLSNELGINQDPVNFVLYVVYTKIRIRPGKMMAREREIIQTSRIHTIVKRLHGMDICFSPPTPLAAPPSSMEITQDNP